MHENLTSILLDLYLICKNNVAQKRGARAGQTKKQRSHAGNRCQSQDFYLHFTKFLHCLGKAGCPCSAKAGVFLVRDRFAPLVAGALAGTSRATWENQLSLAAPCQCLTSGGMTTVSPAERACAGLPTPDTSRGRRCTSRICPPPLDAWWMCQLLRQPGSKVTLAAENAVFTAEGLEVAVPPKYWA